jgi:membrane associated rhomboid family serine protease
MTSMPEDALPPAPAPAVEVCYRHPTQQTRVHCTRCERPICTECMIPAPVGYQCPECVDRARREFRAGPGRPMRGGAIATKTLLGAIIVAFGVEVLFGGPGSLLQPSSQVLFDLGAMQPIAIAGGQFWRLFTAMFLHAGILHLALNGYFFWLFGRQVELHFGTVWMVVIYIVSGFLASVASYAFGPIDSLGVGASGAIAGVFGAFVAFNYRRRNTPAGAANLRMATTLILLNALLAFGYRAIDWRAHLGGIVAGFVLGYLADGAGSARSRTAVTVGGVAALVVAGIAAVVWRTSEIRSIPGFDQFFG